ncbi:MAG: 2-dehydropantoate 2-reductase [Candidatus Omnitrophica bacterium]|nr:2-dehydropantoate 2-reductase [Candidatus Omnitrophota bacterium]
MKILVFGAGAIGSAFGGFLSAQHEVTLLGRRRHLEAVRRNGLKVSGIWGRHTFRRLSLETDFEGLAHRRPEYDLILVTVKSFDTARAAGMIKRILRPGTVVLSLQNGLGNVEALHRRLPAGQVLAGRVIFGVELLSATRGKPDGGGQIKITVSAEPTAVGETVKRAVTPRVKRLAVLFSKAGIATVPCSDIDSLLWKKVAYNCALNPLASLLKTHYGFLGENGITRLIMDEVVEEIFDVAKAAGISMKPSAAGKYLKLFYGKLLPRTYHHHPSMLQDLNRGRPTEIDALNGAIVRLGRKYRVPAPVNRRLTELIKQEERLCPRRTVS